LRDALILNVSSKIITLTDLHKVKGTRAKRHPLESMNFQASALWVY